MTKEETAEVAKKWIKAWNDRDHASLISMMKDGSSFSKMGSVFEPIIKHDQVLIPNLWTHEWFSRKLEIIKQLNLTFDIESIKTGEGFVQVKSRLSNGNYVVDFLRLENDGKIDQLIRNIDNLSWVEIV